MPGRTFLFLLMLALHLPVIVQAAKIETYEFSDPAKEASYQKLTEELRCLVCQNQNLADSNAELAQDLRRKTYEMVSAGKTEQEVVDYMVQRYGDFVLYRPPFRASTLLLWVGPFAILLIGVVVLLRFVRRRPVLDANAMTAEERERAARLLRKEGQEQ